MYEEFFGLRARPFGITPSADLFFHSSAHRRTLACLLGQVFAGEPLIVLTGNIGAGKTTVLQVLLRNLSDKFAPAVLVSTQLDEVELTRSVLIAFGAFDEAAAGGSLEDLRTALRSRLKDLRSHSQRGLLVVDEAQNSSAGTLRYLMHLPELGGGGDEASLQVIISGQPGLRARALLVETAGAKDGHELPLCRLGPMSTTDTGAYVRHRLRVVGSPTDGPTFSDDAIDQVRVATGGLPRLVNRLCDRVLTSACLDRTRDIDAARVARAAAELREELGDSDVTLSPSHDDHQAVQADPPQLPPTLPVPTVVGVGVDSDPASAEASPWIPAQHVGLGDSMPLPPEPPKPPKPPKRTDSQANRRRRSYWVAAAAAGLLVVSFGWLAYDRSSPRNTTRLGATAPAIVAAPAGKADPAEVSHPPGTNAPSTKIPTSTPQSGAQLPVGRGASGVPEPRRPASQPLDTRAAFGLAPSTEPTAAPPVATPPVATPPAAAPPGTSPPGTSPPGTSPPVAEPACSEATKALGLCP